MIMVKRKSKLIVIEIQNLSQAVRIPKITILVSHKTTEYTIKVIIDENDDDDGDDDDCTMYSVH